MVRVHDSALESIEYEEIHPNGSAEVKGFATVKLNGPMINRQLDRIRMSSYRGLGIGVGFWGTKVVDNQSYKTAYKTQSGEIIPLDLIDGGPSSVLYSIGRTCGEYKGDST
jgi:hypothetical protein